MRLSKIKLAGFKSFVDPTTVHFPSNLTGIVGPNGCGKSNVIDAVRWVMGESSAKHLRGDTMADVIFNGSSSRKPVGHATIELVFDNSDGSAGGQYARYNEVAIKRVVGRDGQSHYYLNGARCRRKDITDIFLGTGLGPRSYSIIEQGMISRFIEAKPEELRTFLEEAAGISKYKERRRETENRIRHTRDNLDRINDLRDELEKQLQRLDRQAKVAEKYKLLKEEERLLKAQHLALRWQSADTEAREHEARIRETETEYEAQVAVQRSIEARIEKQRELHGEVTETFNQVQGTYYGVGSDIARVEQAIQHARDKRQQLTTDRREVDASLSEARIDLQADHRRLDELNGILAEVEPALQEAKEVEHVSRDMRRQAEEAMHSWQAEWDQFNTAAAEPARTVEVEQTRIQHLEQQAAQLRQRIDRFEREQEGLSPASLEQEIHSLSDLATNVESDLMRFQEELETCQRGITQQRNENHELSEALDAERSALQTLRGRVASLEALQESALGKRESAVIDWLEARGLLDARRLAQGVDVAEDWERAVETVLGFHLEAVCVDSMDSVADMLDRLQHGALGLFETVAAGAAEDAGRLGTPLAAHVRSDWSIAPLLAGVYVAASLDEALGRRRQLAAHESFITHDGVWVGPNWLRVARDTDEKAGVLHREHEMKQTRATISRLEDQVSTLQRDLDDGKDRLQELEQERDAKQAATADTSRRHTQLQAELSARRASLEQIRTHSQRLTVDVDEARAHLQRSEADVAEARRRLDEANQAVARHNDLRGGLQSRRERLRERLEDAREQSRSDHDVAHQLALRFESARTALESTQAAQQRVQTQIDQLQARRADLDAALEASQEPIVAMERELEALLQRRLTVEAELNDVRTRLQEIEHTAHEDTTARNEAEQLSLQIREVLEQARMELQGMVVRRQTIEEQVDETGFEVGALLDGLPEDASEDAWHERVDRIAQRIARLGPINLAAIDEFRETSERKHYLDEQFADLTEALHTLENAIQKIDRETRTRFKETFDKVNSKLQEMFPRLFGGGMARLELDSDDLLSAGVTLLARPPGKRVSSIHLLSGGEKALTAIAMVFAIFELNPAPFCLLDEVDAPLDDANVGRYCDIVREMSKRVQLIFITHNKISMETANHLTGVTMHEPGVSRIVAVDVDEAATMAAM